MLRIAFTSAISASRVAPLRARPREASSAASRATSRGARMTLPPSSEKGRGAGEDREDPGPSASAARASGDPGRGMRGKGVPGGSVALGLVASGNRPVSGWARALSAPTVAGAVRLRNRAEQPGQVRNPSASGVAVIVLWQRGHFMGDRYRLSRRPGAVAAKYTTKGRVGRGAILS
jgi:hypothetical protein